MSRKRPLLYDVFAPGAGEARTRRRSGVAVDAVEIRLSPGLALGFLVLAVVACVGCYFFGRARANRTENPSSLSVTARTDGNQVGSVETGPEVPAEAKFWAVRVFTFSVPADKGVDGVSEQALKMAEFLTDAKFADVLPLHYEGARKKDGSGFKDGQVVIYVGRAKTQGELSDLLTRLKRLEYQGSRAFSDAVVTQVNLGGR